jgi:ribosome-associated protein
MKYIELNTFLKIKGIASSGGEAKNIIRSKKVKVNNEVETRNKRKLVENDIVVINNQKYNVESKYLLKIHSKP